MSEKRQIVGKASESLVMMRVQESKKRKGRERKVGEMEENRGKERLHEVRNWGISYGTLLSRTLQGGEKGSSPVCGIEQVVSSWSLDLLSCSERPQTMALLLGGPSRTPHRVQPPGSCSCSMLS